MTLQEKALSSVKALTGLATLYAGKASGVLVTLVFIPIYNRELGATQFGIVAVILSLQALLITLDFGIATHISREFAEGALKRARHKTLLRNTEMTLVSIYVALMLTASILMALNWIPRSDWVTVSLSLIMFGALVIQNVYYAGLIAKQFYISASSIYFLGNIGRAVFTAIALIAIEPTVHAFLFAQSFIVLIHLAFMRRYCWKILSGTSKPKLAIGNAKSNWRRLKGVLSKSKGLAIVSIAGAAATQLDKPIMSSLISPDAVTPYFLAITACMIPMSVFAGPIFQYFQPKVVKLLNEASDQALTKTMSQFSAVLAVSALTPACVLWFFSDEFLTLWLGADPSNKLTSHYISLLLPGLTLGALGFLPFSLLLAIRDYRFQAINGACLAVLALAAAVIACLNLSVTGVCLVYVAYHSMSAVIPWIRASRLQPTKVAAVTAAKIVFCISIVPVGLVLLVNSVKTAQ